VSSVFGEAVSSFFSWLEQAASSHEVMANSKTFFIQNVLVLENGVSFKGMELNSEDFQKQDD